MINAAIVGLGWWGRYIVGSLQGKNDTIRFVQAIDIDPDAARATYQENLQAHLDQIGETCRGLGIDHHSFGTERPLERALQEFVLDRSRRRAMPMRGTRA